MKKAAWYPSLGFAILATLGIYFYQQSAQKKLNALETQLREMSSASQALEKRTESLSGSLKRVERLGFATPSASSNEEVTTTVERAQQAPQAASKPESVSLEHSQELVLSAYAKEPRDSVWSRNANQELDTLIKKNLPAGSRLLSVDCRSTLCLVEMAHQDSASSSAFVLNGFMGWRGSIFVANEAKEGGHIAVSYMASREGTEPPLAGTLP